jgi:uncharacterized spore protein YtfJ
MVVSNQNQLITELACVVVAKTAPEELPLFRATSAAYFKNTNKLLKSQMGKDELLGFGLGEAVSLLTPTVLVVVTDAVTFVTVAFAKSVAEESENFISDLIRKLFKRSHKKKEHHDLPPLTPEQLTQVRKRAYEKACQLKLSDDRASLLADAVVGSLVKGRS